MNPRELVRKTLTYSSPERIPRQTWLLPWAEEHFPETVLRLQRDFPDDIVSAPAAYKKPLTTKGGRYQKGEYIDEWGCIFSNPQDGAIGIVQKPLLAAWEEIKDFKTPEVILSLDREAVNYFCRNTDRFVLAGSMLRPFERFQFIRTMEKALMDLLEQPPELFDLLHQIHEFYLKEVELWAQTEVDAIALMDDWGTQQGLIINPEIFRKIFKPMYRDYVEVARKYGKFVFMHSDGYITDVLPDLIEVGVDAINAQIFCMGIEKLGKCFRGKITFWGEIDRQYLLARGRKQEIQRAVNKVFENLYSGGGVIAQCEFGLGARPENIITAYETWASLT